jgi:hypothetical protein
MNGLLIPGGEAEPAAVSPALSERLEHQVFAPARVAGIENLAIAAVTEPPPPVSTLHPPQGGTWIAAYHDSDPVALARGGKLHAPEAEIERLMRLHEAGVKPDAVLIGHQLPGHWQPGDPVPLAYLAGEATTVSRVLAIQAGAVGVGLEVLRAAVKVGAGIGLAIGAVGLAGGAALGATVLVDPFILVGVHERESGLIGWVFLGGWDEESAP